MSNRGMATIICGGIKLKQLHKQASNPKVLSRRYHPVKQKRSRVERVTPTWLALMSWTLLGHTWNHHPPLYHCVNLEIYARQWLPSLWCAEDAGKCQISPGHAAAVFIHPMHWLEVETGRKVPAQATPGHSHVHMKFPKLLLHHNQLNWPTMNTAYVYIFKKVIFIWKHQLDAYIPPPSSN